MPSSARLSHQIDVEMIVVKREPLLSRLKKKSLAQFQQEMLDLVDYGVHALVPPILHPCRPIPKDKTVEFQHQFRES